jgi:hypothetical protein
LGRKKERATKSRPKANPLLPVNLKCWPLLAEVGGVESGVPMAQVFVQMVRWKSRQKRATNGCEAGQKAVKARPTPCSCRGLGGGWRGVLGTKVFCANGTCGEKQRRFSVGKKARPMGARLPKAKANLLLYPLLAAVAGLVLVVVGSGVCSRLEFLCANGDVAKRRRPLSVGKKARPMGARLAKA